MSAMDPLVEDQLRVELDAATSIYNAHCVRCIRHLRTASRIPADQLWHAGRAGNGLRALVAGTHRTLPAVIRVIRD